MVTFSFHQSNFQEMNFMFQKMHYQGVANSIIESFDYNDIQRGIKHAKDTVQKREVANNEEKFEVIEELFNTLMGWLEENGTRFT